jgi:predicted nuclease of predicted toxin-antitoxin system
MKFLVDAQLPKRLTKRLVELGFDTVHASELPDGNRSSDREIALAADRDGRVVITKDRDFEISHLLGRPPATLLLVTTGNISNDDLLTLVLRHLPEIQVAFEQSPYVELSRFTLTVH